MAEKADRIADVTNEIMFVGSMYAKPDLFVEYGLYIRSRFDFSDEATRFFYDNLEIIYKTRSEAPTRSTIMAYYAEDNERLAEFTRYGGIKLIETWVNLAQPEDIAHTYDILKKYSLLREYQKNGFDVTKIMEHPNFQKLRAGDIYRLIRSQADRIHTIILTNQESVVLNSDMEKLVNGCLETPDMGIPMPFPILSDLFRGIKLKTMFCTGMLSNAGKSRFMFRLLAWVALVHKQKVCVLLNEMTVERMKLCLLTTVINNDEFKQLHGVDITKREKELALGLYRDVNGDYIYRHKDDQGNVIEPMDAFIKRLKGHSEEYNNVIEVAEWIEKQTDGLIYAKDISNGYDDKTLEIEIRKARMVHGIDYFFYDTLKQETKLLSEWSALKATTTRLVELTRELKCFIYASIQLTDDTNFIKPDELVSSNIAASKQLKHVVDNLILCKEIAESEKSHYRYIEANKDFGADVEKELLPNKRYYIFNVDKNRDGGRKKIVYEINLDLNTWVECGELKRMPPQSKTKSDKADKTDKKTDKFDKK